jgi:hypothetical protein
MEPDYREFPAWLALALGAAHLPVPRFTPVRISYAGQKPSQSTGLIPV